jgi:hypothetical protein
MDSDKILKNLRTFLLWFSIFIFAGSLVELAFLDHAHETEQLIPYFLIGLGIILSALMLIKPGTGVLKAMRIGMWVVFAGGILGIFFHVSGNLEEFTFTGSLMDLLRAGLGGDNPFLAPGILSMAAVMALFAGYKHPVEKK